jgi:protein-serine/threonine kinase
LITDAFERSTAEFSENAVTKAKVAQVKLESYYKRAVDRAIERNNRCVALAWMDNRI